MKMDKWVEYDHPGECSSECSVGDSDLGFVNPYAIFI